VRKTGLAIGFSFILLIAGCDGGTRVTGLVRDTSGNPIGEAKITLTEIETNRSVPTLSKQDGSYRIGMLHAPSADVRLRLAIEKNGFAPWTLEFKSALRNPEFGITLNRLPNPPK
jgi:hypothetical protein